MIPTDLSIWNSLSIASPSFRTLEYSRLEYERLFGSTNYHLMFADQVSTLLSVFEKSRVALENEKHVLDRLIYKNWNALRKETSMQKMKKLKRSLQKLSALSIDKLTETIQKLTSVNKTSQARLLPSQEVFQYYAIRLYSTYRISEYVMRLVRDRLESDLIRQMRNNIFLANNLLYISTVSRIYCIIRSRQRAVAHIYNCLREYLDLFKSSGDEYTLTTSDLEQLPRYIMTTAREQSDSKSVHKSILTLAIQSDDQEMEDLGEPIERS